jgi:hypothetical protein
MMMAMENKIIQKLHKATKLMCVIPAQTRSGVEWSGVEKERAAAGSRRPDPPTLQMQTHTLLFLFFFFFFFSSCSKIRSKVSSAPPQHRMQSKIGSDAARL